MDQAVAAPRYEPPAIVILGPVSELTLGNIGGQPGDGSATYYEPSDSRLKREARTIDHPLASIRLLVGRGS